MRMTSFAKALAVGLVLVAGAALAQPAAPAPEAQVLPAPQGMPRMPMGQMMQGMPMMQDQGGMMMGCPMMRRMASLDERLRRLEERAGVPAPQPPAQPGPGTR